MTLGRYGALLCALSAAVLALRALMDRGIPLAGGAFCLLCVVGMPILLLRGTWRFVRRGRRLRLFAAALPLLLTLAGQVIYLSALAGSIDPEYPTGVIPEGLFFLVADLILVPLCAALPLMRRKDSKQMRKDELHAYFGAD